MIKPLRAAFFMLPGTADPESPGCRTVTDGKRNKMEKNRQIIVVGAGAAGMMAAISAARSGAAVTILEGMKKPGRKLLMTGNGKCNLTHLDPASLLQAEGRLCLPEIRTGADRPCRPVRRAGKAACENQIQLDRG